MFNTPELYDFEPLNLSPNLQYVVSQNSWTAGGGNVQCSEETCQQKQWRIPKWLFVETEFWLDWSIFHRFTYIHIAWLNQILPFLLNCSWVNSVRRWNISVRMKNEGSACPTWCIKSLHQTYCQTFYEACHIVMYTPECTSHFAFIFVETKSDTFARRGHRLTKNKQKKNDLQEDEAALCDKNTRYGC